MLLFAGFTVASADQPEAKTQCVILLHGLARSAKSMKKMQQALEDEGYVVANVDYPSRTATIEQLAGPAVEQGLSQCEAAGIAAPYHFVTHSLGGILLRQYFSDHDVAVVNRVVMLGPPNQGSQAADAFGNVPGFNWLNGPAGKQLGKGENSVPLLLGSPAFEFAVIAGDRTIDPITSAVLDNPDDGRVSVADTRLDGMQDFRVLPVSHAFMMRNKEVFELVFEFLEHGRFSDTEVEQK